MKYLKFQLIFDNSNFFLTLLGLRIIEVFTVVYFQKNYFKLALSIVFIKLVAKGIFPVDPNKIKIIKLRKKKKTA